MRVSAFFSRKINKKYFEEIEWVEHPDHYLAKHTKNGKQTFQTLKEAQAACMMLSMNECAGVTQTKKGFQPRKGSDGKRASRSGEISFIRHKVNGKSKSVFNETTLHKVKSFYDIFIIKNGPHDKPRCFLSIVRNTIQIE